jgi:hypothetical protein
MKTDVLDSWTHLNAYLLKADEQACVELLKREQTGKNRVRFVLRIHSRYNRMRAHRERKALKAKR